MSKLGWSIDDQRFMELNKAQWSWLSRMIAKEEKYETEKLRNFTEYGASFWNYDAVKKIRETRENRNTHAFMSDKEFEDSIKKNDFKNNPWVRRIIEMRKNNANLREYSDLERKHSMYKSPTDLSYLASLTEED